VFTLVKGEPDSHTQGSTDHLQNKPKIRIIGILLDFHVRGNMMTQISVSEASRNLSHWINQATYGRKPVVVTSHGKAKAVIISAEAFEQLIGIHGYVHRELLPPEQLRQEFQQALAEAGYDDRETIINLVRQVKQEMVEDSA
jgi:prevent-host-death family protein